MRGGGLDGAVAHLRAVCGRRRGPIRERLLAKTIDRDHPDLVAVDQIGRKLTARLRNASSEFALFRAEVLEMLKQIRDYRKDS